MAPGHSAPLERKSKAASNVWYAVVRGVLQNREWSGVTQDSAIALHAVSRCPLGASTWMVTARSESEAQAIIDSELCPALQYPHGPVACRPQLHDVVVYTDGGCANLGKGILSNFPALSPAECMKRNIYTVPYDKIAKSKARKARRLQCRIEREEREFEILNGMQIPTDTVPVDDQKCSESSQSDAPSANPVCKSTTHCDATVFHVNSSTDEIAVQPNPSTLDADKPGNSSTASQELQYSTSFVPSPSVVPNRSELGVDSKSNEPSIPDSCKHHLKVSGENSRLSALSIPPANSIGTKVAGAVENVEPSSNLINHHSKLGNEPSDVASGNSTPMCILKRNRSSKKVSFNMTVVRDKVAKPKSVVAPLLLYGFPNSWTSKTPYQDAQKAHLQNICLQSPEPVDGICGGETAEREDIVMVSPSAKVDSRASGSSVLLLNAGESNAARTRPENEQESPNNAKETKKAKKAKSKKKTKKAKIAPAEETCRNSKETAEKKVPTTNVKSSKVSQVIDSPAGTVKSATPKRKPLLVFGVATDEQASCQIENLQSKPQGSPIEHEPSIGTASRLNASLVSNQSVHAEESCFSDPASLPYSEIGQNASQVDKCVPWLASETVNPYDAEQRPLPQPNPGLSLNGTEAIYSLGVGHFGPVLWNGTQFGISNPNVFPPPMNCFLPYQHPIFMFPSTPAFTSTPWGVQPMFPRSLLLPPGEQSSVNPEEDPSGVGIPSQTVQKHKKRLSRKQRKLLPDQVPAAGYGVWFGEAFALNVSAPLEGKIQSSRRAELRALVAALEIVLDKMDWAKRVLVRSDAKLQDARIIIKKLKGSLDVVNEDWDLWMRLDKAFQALDERSVNVSLEWVKSHATSYGNYRADELATSGIVQKAIQLQPCGLEAFRKHRKFVPKPYKVHAGRITKHKASDSQDVVLISGDVRRRAPTTNEDIVTAVESTPDDSFLSLLPKETRKATYTANNLLTSIAARKSSASGVIRSPVVDLTSVDSQDADVQKLAHASIKEASINGNDGTLGDIVNLCSDNDNADDGMEQKCFNNSEGVEKRDGLVSNTDVIMPACPANVSDKMANGYVADSESMELSDCAYDGHNDMFAAMQKAEETAGLYDKEGRPTSPGRGTATIFDVDSGVEVVDLSQDK